MSRRWWYVLDLQALVEHVVGGGVQQRAQPPAVRDHLPHS
eukprot:COSAG02_NODE_59515_length_274_cov_0.588571_1_plen_39_part_01